MIFILATMVFFILRILPGDPVTSALGPKGTPEMIQHIRATLGLNDPLIVQYGRFLWNMITCTLGTRLWVATSDPRRNDVNGFRLRWN